MEQKPVYAYGVEMMRREGFVPPSCQIPEDLFSVAWDYVKRGQSPCEGCSFDRNICKGQPKREDGGTDES